MYEIQIQGSHLSSRRKISSLKVLSSAQKLIEFFLQFSYYVRIVKTQMTLQSTKMMHGFGKKFKIYYYCAQLFSRMEIAADFFNYFLFNHNFFIIHHWGGWMNGKKKKCNFLFLKLVNQMRKKIVNERNLKRLFWIFLFLFPFNDIINEFLIEMKHKNAIPPKPYDSDFFSIFNFSPEIHFQLPLSNLSQTASLIFL